MKTKLFLAIMVVVFLILSAGCAGQEQTPTATPTETMTKGYSGVNTVEVNEMIMAGNVVIVDVSPVWAQGHLPGAISIPLATINDEIMYLNKDNSYLIYCHSDTASMQGAETFVNNGFSPVYRLIGNYQAWTNAGGTVEKPMYTDVMAADAKKMMEDDPMLVVVDVSPVYAQGHLPGAISVPLSSIDTEIKTLDKSAHYLIYCHSDSASIQGAETFMNAGFNPVYRLEGNYQAWVDAGYAVEV